jgi:hypothetical protein
VKRQAGLGIEPGIRTEPEGFDYPSELVAMSPQPDEPLVPFPVESSLARPEARFDRGGSANEHEIDNAWAAVEANWGDADAHRRFIALCALQGALPTAGKRYREIRDSDPARRDFARRQIDAVMASALSNLDLTRAPRPAGRRRLLWIGYGLCAFFVLYTLLSILRGHRP